MSGARFNQINLVVRNMHESLACYRRLGLDIPEPWSSGGHGHHVKAATGGEVDLEFDSHQLARAYNQGFAAERGRVVIGLSLESREAVDALVKGAIAAGGTHALEPQDHGFMYGWSFYDLDGHHWEVLWMDPAHVQR